MMTTKQQWAMRLIWGIAGIYVGLGILRVIYGQVWLGLVWLVCSFVWAGYIPWAWQRIFALRNEDRRREAAFKMQYREWDAQFRSALDEDEQLRLMRQWLDGR